MDLQSFKKEYIQKELGINEGFGRIFSFVDFANVNNWFVEDRQDWENNLLADNEKLEINIKGLKEFADMLGGRVSIYYGEDQQNGKSGKFTDVLRDIFGKVSKIGRSGYKCIAYKTTHSS